MIKVLFFFYSINNKLLSKLFIGCISKKIWLLLRHGTRYPGKKYASSMIENLPKLKKIILDNYKENKTKFTKEEAVLFKEWKISFSKDNIMKLTEEGEDEMIDIGERYQSRFPNLMPEIYNNQTYKVNNNIYFLFFNIFS